jgi:hypothetical protein
VVTMARRFGEDFPIARKGEEEGKGRGDGALRVEAELAVVMVVAKGLSSGLFIGWRGQFAGEIFFPGCTSILGAPSLFFPARKFKSKAVVHSVTLSSPGQKTPSSAMAVATVDSLGAAAWCSCSTVVARWRRKMRRG